jgi:hypothetical protein
MYNFVRILVDYQLIYRRGLKFGSFTTSTPLYKINKREQAYKRASLQASERASRRDNMTKEDKLKKALTKFLNKYSWGAMEHLEKDNGIGVGYFDEEDKPEHVKEVSELYKLLNESEQKG